MFRLVFGVACGIHTVLFLECVSLSLKAWSDPKECLPVAPVERERHPCVQQAQEPIAGYS